MLCSALCLSRKMTMWGRFVWVTWIGVITTPRVLQNFTWFISNNTLLGLAVPQKSWKWKRTSTNKNGVCKIWCVVVTHVMLLAPLTLFLFFFGFFWLFRTWDLPQPGIKPMPLNWEHGVLTSGPSGKSNAPFFLNRLFRRAVLVYQNNWGKIQSSLIPHSPHPYSLPCN